MDTMQWIVALVIGLLLLIFGFFFVYKYVGGAGEGMESFTSDEVAQAKQQCEVACAQARLARSCEDWQKKYCEKLYLTSTCGEEDGDELATCEAPEKFGDGTGGVDCSCKYQLI